MSMDKMRVLKSFSFHNDMWTYIITDFETELMSFVCGPLKKTKHLPLCSNQEMLQMY